MKDLREDFCNNSVDIEISEPVVLYKETITAPSDHQIMSKSANKHNRLYFESCPISEAVIKSIDDREINPDQEGKVRARILAD